MESTPNIDKILFTLKGYPWTKGKPTEEENGVRKYDTISMLLLGAGVAEQEIPLLNMGNTWPRFGTLLKSEYGLRDVVDYYLILIAGDSGVSTGDVLKRVASVLSGNLEAIAPFYRQWISSLVANREKLNADCEELMLKMKPKQIPEFIRILGETESDPYVQIAKQVWNQKETFIRWPKRQYRFWPGLRRAKASGRNNCYQFSPEQTSAIADAGLNHRAWSNDPAIYAFKIAGGERPVRADGKWEWTIHHIYDGKFPSVPGQKSTHAVEHADYFTEAAGLVAIHPIADALATEVPYFAWLLRHEAFVRYGFDPDKVFGTSS